MAYQDIVKILARRGATPAQIEAHRLAYQTWRSAERAYSRERQRLESVLGGRMVTVRDGALLSGLAHQRNWGTVASPDERGERDCISTEMRDIRPATPDEVTASRDLAALTRPIEPRWEDYLTA
jgi:hypothetical protein